MPREAVVVTQPVLRTSLDDGSYAFTPYVDGPIGKDQKALTYPLVEIAWGRNDGLVQIGFQMTRERWIEIADMLRTDPDIIDHTEYTGSTTRKQLNDTIRTVRRARDSALGADE